MDLGEASDQALISVSNDPPSSALVSFVDALARARYAAPRPPKWWISSALNLDTRCCIYCGNDVQQSPVLDPIIPVVAGGPHEPHAVVLCCKRCKRSRREKDLLAWKSEVSSALKALRMRTALRSFNHLTRFTEGMLTKDQAEAVLIRRWSLPRFQCHAAVIPEGGFIGWRSTSMVPSNVQLKLVFQHRAGRFRTPTKEMNRRHAATSVIYWFPDPDKALDAVWDVIEHNGLVRPVHLGPPSVALCGEPDAEVDWTRVFPTVGDLVKGQKAGARRGTRSVTATDD